MLHNTIENFVFDDQAVQVIVRGGEPWFVAAHVCRVLGIQNTSDALAALDDDEKDVINLRKWAEETGEYPRFNLGNPPGSLGVNDANGDRGGNPNVNIISESGLYMLVLRSRRAATPGTVEHRFRKWVTHEVLPAIRRHGGYGHNSGASPDPVALDMARDGSFSEKLRCIELALKVHGRTRAQEMWRKMGLPEVPPAPPTERDEARKCLIHLLDFVVTDIDGERATIRELIDGSLDESEAGRALLIRHGVKLHRGGEGFLVANSGPAVTRIFAGTRWRGGRHYWVLRKLAGVRPHRARFGMVTYRATFIPLLYLDEGAPAPDLAEMA